MGALLSFIKGPAGDVLGSIKDVAGKFIADPQKKMEFELEMAKLEGSLIEKAVTADAELAKVQRDVLVAEATSQSWMARNWRPLLALVLVAIVALNFLIAPLFHITVPPMEPRLWDTLDICLGGYIASRGIEKVAPAVAAIFTKK